jgi:Photosynthesis system II assembly factor YCF48
MEELQELIEREVKEVARLILERQLAEKLKEAGLSVDAATLSKAAAHIMSGSQESFKFKGGEDVTIQMTNDDIEYVVKATEQFYNEHLARILDKVADDNGGEHWTAQTSSTSNNLQSVAFAADGRHGWAVGWGGTILATEDGGAHWIPQASPTYNYPFNLYAVAFAADGRHGWAVGTLGAILATEDGGAHWTEQASAASNNLEAIAVTADGRHGWAVGWSGTIVAMEDGGGHWKPQTSLTSDSLEGVAFAADGRHGWAVGGHGTVLATEDGGEHWTRQVSSTSNNLEGVAVAADGRHGWAVGWACTILIPVGTAVLDEASVKLAQSATDGEIEVSFVVRGNPWLPIWAAHVEARTEKRDWSPVGIATAEAGTSGNERRRLTWNPAENDFRPGDTIQHRVMIYAGVVSEGW